MTNMDSASAARNIADQAADRVGPTIAVAVHIRQQDEIIAGLRRELEEITTANRNNVAAHMDAERRVRMVREENQQLHRTRVSQGTIIAHLRQQVADNATAWDLGVRACIDAAPHSAPRPDANPYR